MPSILRFLILLLPALLVSSTAHAVAPRDYSAELKPGYALLDKGDYAHAYPIFLRHSGGNALAQFTLGLFHQNGWGRPANADAACTWFAKAAKHHIPAAQHAHGECLLRTPGNEAAALASYLAAAQGSHYISLCSAADLLVHGKGVPRDVPRGLAICTQAAQVGAPQAMLRMAQFLSGEADVPPDLPQARAWFEQAARSGNSEARFRLAIMQSQGDGGKVDRDAALAGMESLAMEGYIPAYLPTAVLYAHLPVEPDTGALSAEHLAKVYLWASAAKARLKDPGQADQLLSSVLAVMPAEWRPELDRRVADHLAKFAVPGA